MAERQNVHTGAVRFRMSDDLKGRADAAAREQHMSLSEWLRHVVRKALQDQSTHTIGGRHGTEMLILPVLEAD